MVNPTIESLKTEITEALSLDNQQKEALVLWQGFDAKEDAIVLAFLSEIREYIIIWLSCSTVTHL